MKKRYLFILLILLLTFTPISTNQVSAQARTLSWSVIVWYQNVGDQATPVEVNIFPENSNVPIVYDAGVIEASGTASFFAGDVHNISAGFRGNAVLSASQPMTATMMFFNPNQSVRMFSNGFTTSDGSNQFLIATTLSNMWSRTTIFSIQNIEAEPVTITLNFYDAEDGSLASSREYQIPANSSKYIEMDKNTDTGLPPVFNGSVIIDAVKTANGQPARVVSSANELYTNRNVGASFGGLPLDRASNKVYLSTGLCTAFNLDTYYAVQNTSYTESVEIVVEYFDLNGNSITTDGPYAIGPGQKQSIRTCDPSSGRNMTGFSGSAVITTTDPSGRIVALGKAQTQRSKPSATFNVFTIFNGEERGYSRIGFPYVRWTSDSLYRASNNMGTDQRTFIAVQNLEPTAAKVNVYYFDNNGEIVGVHNLTVPGFSKVNTNPHLADALGKNGMNPGMFGYYTDGSFGGGAILEAHPDNPTAEFIAIVRVQHPGWGEDYNGIGLD